MIDYAKISCCLITKEDTYPKEILDVIQSYPFGEILILTHSDSPYRKYELFQKSKNDLIYYQDDDAICPIDDIVQASNADQITVAMKEGHYESYKDKKYTMGLGWGAVFPKKLLSTLSKYTDVYGEDDVFQRETERILTHFNFPQNRLVLPIIDLPSAYNADRLWRQTNHIPFMQVAEERCKKLLKK